MRRSSLCLIIIRLLHHNMVPWLSSLFGLQHQVKNSFSSDLDAKMNRAVSLISAPPGQTSNVLIGTQVTVS